MFSISAYQKPSTKQLRSFGLVLAIGFALMGTAPIVFGQGNPIRWILAISLFFLAAGTVVPNALRPIHRVWMLLGNILGWINTKIILGAVYYLVVTPVSFLMGLFAHDPMNRRFDSQAQTYRVPRKARPASHMKHQF